MDRLPPREAWTMEPQGDERPSGSAPLGHPRRAPHPGPGRSWPGEVGGRGLRHGAARPDGVRSVPRSGRRKCLVVSETLGETGGLGLTSKGGADRRVSLDWLGNDRPRPLPGHTTPPTRGKRPRPPQFHGRGQPAVCGAGPAGCAQQRALSLPPTGGRLPRGGGRAALARGSRFTPSPLRPPHTLPPALCVAPAPGGKQVRRNEVFY